MDDTLTDLDRAALLSYTDDVFREIERGVFVDALSTMTRRCARLAGRLEEIGEPEDAKYVRTAVAALDDAREAIAGGVDR